MPSTREFLIEPDDPRLVDLASECVSLLTMDVPLRRLSLTQEARLVERLSKAIAERILDAVDDVWGEAFPEPPIGYHPNDP